MAGLFQGIEIGKRALLTHQINLQTIGQNIANVNTPGYRRQRVNIRATIPELSTLGSIGSGVEVVDIRHVRDLFLGNQFRQENKSLGQWSYKQKVLSQIEGLFSEPNDNTLSDQINRFWDAWSDLSTLPDSSSSRVALVQQTKLLTNSFRGLASQLNNLRASIDDDLSNLVKEVNRLVSEIAKLNSQVAKFELDGSSANDLRDIRDNLIDRLSDLVDVNTREDKSGATVVYIGAMAIVDGPDTIDLDTRIVNKDGILTNELVWKGTKIEVQNLNGQLKGLMDTRDKLIPGYLAELNTLSSTIISQVNQLHSAGYDLNGTTGVNFFNTKFTDAANMEINSQILLDTNRIAVSGTGEVGDNTIALAIHNLRNQRVLSNGSSTINDFYNNIVGKLGIEANQANTTASNLELVIAQLNNSRQAVEGVSLDEEMVSLIKFQHAYNAAARVITAMDQALDTLIFGTGIVGR